MKLGVVLARREDLGLARAMSAAARRAGDEVRWFVMDDGVAAVGAPGTGAKGEELEQGFEERPEERPEERLEELLDDELEIIACATSVDQRAIATAKGVQLGSQDDHAALLAWADRVVALT